MITAIIFAAALAAAPEAATPTTSAPATITTPAAPAASSEANKTICRHEEATGSRLGAMRVCMTKAQWDERSAQDKATFQGVLNQNNATSSH